MVSYILLVIICQSYYVRTPQFIIKHLMRSIYGGLTIFKTFKSCI